MFSSTQLVITLFALVSLAPGALAHAIITPALGVNGTATRNDVQRPATNALCGKVNVTAELPLSTTITVNKDGSFMANITNFNGGKDGSRQVTALVDTAAIGSNFTVTANVTQNGDLAPTSVGSQELVVQLPPGTTCTGGPSGNLCLVSFKTAGGFGNCVVLSQSAGKTKTCSAKKGSGTGQPQKRELLVDPRAAGTRAARAFRGLLQH